MNRSRRSFFAVLLALLLFGMQAEGLRHAVTHTAAALAEPQQQSLQLPNDVPCLECELLAGTTSVTIGSIAALVAIPASILHAFVLPRSTPQSAPSYYRSRAPPLSL